MAKKITYEHRPVRVFSVTAEKMREILDGRSTWFLKSHNSEVRGSIALSVIGTHTVYATAILHSVTQLLSSSIGCIMDNSPSDRLDHVPPVMYAFALDDVKKLVEPFVHTTNSDAAHGRRFSLSEDESLALADAAATHVEAHTDGILQTLFYEQCAPLFPWKSSINVILARYDDITDAVRKGEMPYEAISSVISTYERGEYPSSKRACMNRRYDLAHGILPREVG